MTPSPDPDRPWPDWLFPVVTLIGLALYLVDRFVRTGGFDASRFAFAVLMVLAGAFLIRTGLFQGRRRGWW